MSSLIEHTSLTGAPPFRKGQQLLGKPARPETRFFRVNEKLMVFAVGGSPSLAMKMLGDDAREDIV